jgi:hypothetical protein
MACDSLAWIFRHLSALGHFPAQTRRVIFMPIGAQDHLETLYARQRLLSAEATRLESERDALEHNSDQRYILDVEINALREEATRISARIADIIERDLQR